MSLTATRAEAQHDAECPGIGPICEVRPEPPQQHHTTLWLTEARLLGEYGLIPNLAVQGILPFRVINAGTLYTDLAANPVQLDYENIHHRNETLAGLGDAQLLLHGAARLGELKVGARLGVSFPTGKVQANPYTLGDTTGRLSDCSTGYDPVTGLPVMSAIPVTVRAI